MGREGSYPFRRDDENLQRPAFELKFIVDTNFEKITLSEKRRGNALRFRGMTFVYVNQRRPGEY